MTLSNENFFKIPYGTSKGKDRQRQIHFKTLKRLILSLADCYNKHAFDLTRDTLHGFQLLPY